MTVLTDVRSTLWWATVVTSLCTLADGLCRHEPPQLSCWHDFRRALACTERLEIGCFCHTSKFSSAVRAEDDGASRRRSSYRGEGARKNGCGTTSNCSSLATALAMLRTSAVVRGAAHCKPRDTRHRPRSGACRCRPGNGAGALLRLRVASEVDQWRCCSVLLRPAARVRGGRRSATSFRLSRNRLC